MSGYLPPGDHRDLPIRLSDPITESQTLAAIAYRDGDGDRTFDFVASSGTHDGPYVVPYVRNTTGDAVVSGPAVGGRDVHVGADAVAYELRRDLGLRGGGGADGNAVERAASSAGFRGLLAAAALVGVVLWNRFGRRGP